MNDTHDEGHTRKELLKALREARKQSIEALARKMKEQKKIVGRIKELLAQCPKTVPAMASELGVPSSEIMWYVAALKKYGEVAEGEKEDGYFRYELAGSTAPEDSGLKG